MKNLRTYGQAPYRVAVVHGGPGAAGEMAPVAREIASACSVLEPLQAATSLHGQIEELRAVLEQYGNPPLDLIGFSWGAWLSFIFAAHYPDAVEKLILVGSGPYEAKYAARIEETRFNRLNEKGKGEFNSLVQILESPENKDKRAAFSRLGALLSKTDAYDPMTTEAEEIDFQPEIFHKVWKEAAEFRRSGELLQLGKRIQCPVVAVHGDWDPHPAEGVQAPLSAVLSDFRFIPLKNCGHRPWIERQARDEFYAVLREELRHTN